MAYQALQDAIQQLYQTFAPYQSQSIAATAYRTSAVNPSLTTTTLSSLSFSQLTPLIAQLPEIADSDQVFRRFLPRILELSVSGYDRWCMGLDHIFAMLATYQWQTWSRGEVEAIETFMSALWHYHLQDVPPSGTSSSADTILEAMGRMMDISSLLQTWSDTQSQCATMHIASLAVYGQMHHRAVRQWLAQPSILQRIEAAFWDCGNSDNAAMFAKAAEYLRLTDTLAPA